MYLKFVLLLSIILISSGNSYADIILSNSLKMQPNEMLQKGRPIPKQQGELCTSILDMSALRQEHIRTWVYRFLTRNNGYVRKALENSVYYRQLTYYQFRKRSDIPIVLSDLPMLESCFDPYAVSHAGASGIWQFMPQTATGVGLTISRYEDQRRSIIRSTKAALDHLQYLHSRHGSWEYALAAYNCGSGRIDTQTKQYPDKSYWELVDMNVLPYETSHYVQKFAALSLLYRHYKTFGINIPQHKKFSVSRYTFKSPVRIDELSRKTGMPKSVIHFLNPHLKGNTTPLNRENYQLIIPTQYKNAVMRKEKSLSKIKVTHVKKHRIRKGEALSTIAKHYNVNMQKIIDYNGLKKPYRIYPGKYLYIPL